jgi:hypothetical protein
VGLEGALIYRQGLYVIRYIVHIVDNQECLTTALVLFFAFFVLQEMGWFKNGFLIIKGMAIIDLGYSTLDS